MVSWDCVSVCCILFMLVILLIIFLLIVFLFFFFKQKTAYEMRISDWSSDVCSSDLRCRARGGRDHDHEHGGEAPHVRVPASSTRAFITLPTHLKRDRKSVV